MTDSTETTTREPSKAAVELVKFPYSPILDDILFEKFLLLAQQALDAEYDEALKDALNVISHRQDLWKKAAETGEVSGSRVLACDLLIGAISALKRTKP